MAAWEDIVDFKESLIDSLRREMTATFPPSSSGASFPPNFGSGLGLSSAITLQAYGAKGDGVANDTAAVTAAFQAAASTFSSVYVLPGTYMVDNIVIPVGVASIIATPGAIFKRRATGTLMTVNSPGMRIDNLTIDGNGASFGGGSCVLFIGTNVTDVLLDRCIVTGADATVKNAILTSGNAHRFTVRNSTIYGNVIPQNSDNCQIDNCNFLTPPVAGALYGVGVWAVTSPGNHANGTRITKNYFEIPDAMFAVVPLSRNGADPPKGTVIANNTMVSFGASSFGGISVDTCADCVVDGNSFRVASGSPTTAALEIVGSANVTATGNDFDGGGVMDQVISLNNSSNCTITGNSLRSPNSVGVAGGLIHFFAPSAGKHCYRNVIADNEFVNPAGGGGMVVLAPNNATATVEETSITGNEFYGNASSRGIVLDGTVGVGAIARTTIRGNQFVTMSQAIRFFNDTDTVVSDNRFATDITTRFSQGGGSLNTQIKNNDFQTASAAPTTQSHFAGTIVWNSNPAVGQPIGWICTVTGTPGTWVAMANL